MSDPGQEGARFRARGRARGRAMIRPPQQEIQAPPAVVHEVGRQAAEQRQQREYVAPHPDWSLPAPGGQMGGASRQPWTEPGQIDRQAAEQRQQREYVAPRPDWSLPAPGGQMGGASRQPWTEPGQIDRQAAIQRQQREYVAPRPDWSLPAPGGQMGGASRQPWTEPGQIDRQAAIQRQQREYVAPRPDWSLPAPGGQMGGASRQPWTEPGQIDRQAAEQRQQREYVAPRPDWSLPAPGGQMGGASRQPWTEPGQIDRQAAEQRQQQQLQDVAPPTMRAYARTPDVALERPFTEPIHPGGRANNRGRPGAQYPGARGDPEEGAVEGVSSAMENMSIAVHSGRGEAKGRKRGALMDFNYDEHVTRPEHVKENKTGDSGHQITVVSNLFRLNRLRMFAVHQYHVEFKPAVDSLFMRKGMINQISDIIGPIHMFDGMQLFLPINLERNPQTAYVKSRSDGTEIKIEIKKTAVIPVTSPVCIQLYNIIFRKVLVSIGMQLIGRDYFNPRMSVEVRQHRLELWPGYISSILQFETQPHLIADVSHKVLSSSTVLDRLYEIYNLFKKMRNGDLKTFQETAKKEIVGQIVLTRYNNKTYRIDDIDWKKNPDYSFKHRDGTEETLVAYYKRAYNINIDNMEQPMLVSRPNKRDQRAGQTEDILLLPELCSMTGLADEVRTNFTVMRDLAKHTRIDPDTRVARLRQLLAEIRRNAPAQKAMRDWNFDLSDDLTEIAARVLPVEKIIMGRQPFSYDANAAEWSQAMRNEKLLVPKPIQNWLMVFTKYDKDCADNLSVKLDSVFRQLGMFVRPPRKVPIENDRPTSYIQALNLNCRPEIEFVVCVLKSSHKGCYDAIKKYLCVENPIPSQMILTKTLNKQQTVMSVCTKLAIQINCKLGGECWAVDIPLKSTMVVGIDTYHDSLQKNRSVVGFVASMNSTYSRWYTCWNFQGLREELGSGLQVAMIQCLKQFYRVNNDRLPARIIIYRDGVGDGQLNMVREYELPQIIEGFSTLQAGYKPQIALIVVKKRINHRFFVRNPGRNGPEFFNPQPGTLIDREATRPEWYDFFLVSQSVRQGTVTPTHYNVVHDTTFLKPDDVQRLTYKLCHLYYNWPGTIRVPAPCQYAHKVAFLIGQSLHRDPRLELADKLFYL